MDSKLSRHDFHDVPGLWSMSRSTTCHQQHMQKHLCSSMAESERLIHGFQCDLCIIKGNTTWFQCYGSDMFWLENSQEIMSSTTISVELNSIPVSVLCCRPRIDAMPERFPLAVSTASSNVQLWDVAMCRNARGAGAWNRGVFSAVMDMVTSVCDWDIGILESIFINLDRELTWIHPKSDMDDEPWMMHDTLIINDDKPVCGPHPPILGTQRWSHDSTWHQGWCLHWLSALCRRGHTPMLQVWGDHSQYGRLNEGSPKWIINGTSENHMDDLWWFRAIAATPHFRKPPY